MFLCLQSNVSIKRGHSIVVTLSYRKGNQAFERLKILFILISNISQTCFASLDEIRLLFGRKPMIKNFFANVLIAKIESFQQVSFQ